MDNSALQKLIHDSIHEVSLEYMKELKRQQHVQNTNDFLNSSSISEDEVDNTLFFGGHPKKEEKKVGPITIKEGAESGLKITIGEIKEFENSFKQMLDGIPGASIVFDKQKNGYSIIATKRADGVEAKASGIINLGDNGKLIWFYSILNGITLNAQNIKLNEGNKAMFETLYNHYNDWQKKWREMLNLPKAPEEVSAAEAAPTLSTSPLPGAGLEQNAPPVSGPGAGPGADAGSGASTPTV